MLHVQGVSIERGDWSGHDTSLRGWPWVEGTHSWLEPTAINLLALEHTGHGTHPRAIEAGRMLHDRLLPGGGCNYGNTVVFGQELRPHMQPTGMCLLALAGCSERTPRIEASVGYLQRELSDRTTTDSLCYALMGLAAWQRVPAGADEWLSKAAERDAGARRGELQAGAACACRDGRAVSADSSLAHGRRPDTEGGLSRDRTANIPGPRKADGPPRAAHWRRRGNCRTGGLAAGAPGHANDGAGLRGRNQRYDGPMEQTIRDGLIATGFDPAACGRQARAAQAEPGRADAPIARK